MLSSPGVATIIGITTGDRIAARSWSGTKGTEKQEYKFDRVYLSVAGNSDPRRETDRMRLPGGGAESSMDVSKRRGWTSTRTMLLAVVLLVGMSKIHAVVAEYEDTEQEWSVEEEFEFEQEVVPTQRLSELELHQEAQRRMVLEAEYSRRMLAGGGGYYIGYGALSAGRVTCPPRSGRSYYTRRCTSASGPARPYTRTCSTISRCARDG
ncbi:hypothetical protein R1sor_004022 [Riccia sorocarpa]|uniref:Uncharacterized protein n=1 Tax=Riccia sorocarpa TaxID=122646 RepID=A0ABD3H6U6_9MARC